MAYPRKLYDPPKRITDPVMRLRFRQNKLTKSYVRGTITQSEFTRQNERIEQQIKNLMVRL